MTIKKKGKHSAATRTTKSCAKPQRNFMVQLQMTI